jgi:hypothetical protein
MEVLIKNERRDQKQNFGFGLAFFYRGMKTSGLKVEYATATSTYE